MAFGGVFSDDQREAFGNDARGQARFDQALEDWRAIQRNEELAIHIDSGGRASVHLKDRLLIATRDAADDRLQNTFRDIGVSDEEYDRVRREGLDDQQAAQESPDAPRPGTGVTEMAVGTNQCVVAATKFLRALGGRRPLRVAPNNVLWPFQGRVFGPAYPAEWMAPPDGAAAQSEALDLPDERVKVAVLDTGFIPEANLALDQVTAQHQLDPWWNPNSDPPSMGHWVGGHGTHVAGVLAAAADYAVELYHFNVGRIDDGLPLIADTDLADAVRAALEAGCRVINMSLGGPTALDLGLPAVSLAIRTAAGSTEAKEAGASDAVIVAAAGNEGTSQPMYPAANKGVIGVGALVGNVRAEFSNYGPWVDCATDGVDVAGPYVTDLPAPPDPASGDERRFQGWAAWSGTSFAAPFVAGRIARALARPDVDSARVAAAMVLAGGTTLPAPEQLGVRIS